MRIQCKYLAEKETVNFTSAADSNFFHNKQMDYDCTSSNQFDTYKVLHLMYVDFGAVEQSCGGRLSHISKHVISFGHYPGVGT